MAAEQAEPARDGRGRRPRLPRPRRVTNPEARMSLVDHIRELRNRIFKALLAALIGTIIGWVFLYHPVFHFMEGPFCQLHHVIAPVGAVSSVGSAAAHPGCGNTLYVMGIFEPLLFQLKISIAIGIVISAPVWLYQVWAFVAPGLHAREKRWAYFFAGSAFPLFAMGGAVAYFAMTKGLRFLLGLTPQGVGAIISVNSYLSYAEAMLLIFGLSFELPLVMVLLNLAGVLTHQRFAKWRRLIIFGVFAFAAVATPSPDPISMLLLAVPCVLLVELAEVFALFNDRRKARRGPVYPGLSPEEVAEYGLDEDLSGEEFAGQVYSSPAPPSDAPGFGPADRDGGA
jgi:sec-independent protein translocase protein TatC